MSPELATIIARLDLAYDNLLTTSLLVNNLRREGNDHFTPEDFELLCTMSENLEELVKREVKE